MKKLLLIYLLSFCALSISAEELEPMADFRIHTIVSSNPRTFEGNKLRAIVEYGELGLPSIFIESTKVEMGHPSPSKIFWREKVDETGGVINVCREPGLWRCSLDNLKWKDSTLVYDLKTPRGAYQCSARVIEGQKPKTNCSKGFSPICGAINFSGIVPGVTTDSEVQRLLGNGVSRDEIDAVSRYFVDSKRTATLQVRSCTDLIVCEVIVQEGIAVNPTDISAAISQWFNPHQRVGPALKLGSTKDEVKKNLGDPVNDSTTDAWRYDSTCTCALPVFFTVYFKNDRIQKVVFSAPSD